MRIPKRQRDWIEQRGYEAQEAADRNDTKTLYRIIRDLTRTRRGQGAPIKDKNGKAGHFKDMLNQSMSTELLAFNPPALDKDLAVNLDAITKTETVITIRQLKNYEAPGLDMISAEILKHGGHPIKQLTTLLNTCWATAEVLED